MHKRTILNLALALSIFLLPSNWFIVLTTQGSSVHGLQVDYLLPKLYASLLATLIFTGLWLWWHPTAVRQMLARYPLAWASAGGGILMLALHQLITTRHLSSWWFLAQLITVGLFTVALYHQRKLLSTSMSVQAIYLTICFQVLLGGYQFLTQTSMGGYWLLGEPRLSTPFGLATSAFGGRELVLAYGTTPHPNILAGVVIGLLLLAMLVTQQKATLSNPRYLAYLLVGASTVYITQSLSGLLVLVAGVFFLTYRTHKQYWSIRNLTLALSVMLTAIPLALAQASTTVDHSSLERRALLNRVAVQMLAQKPLWGGGVNSFTRRVEEFGGSETVRFVQPAHHTPLLIVAEVGVIGVVLLLVVWSILPALLRRTMLITAVLLTGPLALDHYLYTLPQGMLLFSVLLSASALVMQQKFTGEE